MDSGVITLSEVLWRMGKGERFDIEFVTCNRKKGTGGAIRRITNCIQYGTGRSARPKPVVVGDETTDAVKKSPHHFENSTRNIYSFAAGEKTIRKVHLRLITRFNGKRVL